MTYVVQINYFDRHGDQHAKHIQRKTIEGLKKAIKDFADTHEIYKIPAMSIALFDNEEFNEYIKQFGWSK